MLNRRSLMRNGAKAVFLLGAGAGAHAAERSQTFENVEDSLDGSNWYVYDVEPEFFESLGDARSAIPEASRAFGMDHGGEYMFAGDEDFVYIDQNFSRGLAHLGEAFDFEDNLPAELDIDIWTPSGGKYGEIPDKDFVNWALDGALGRKDEVAEDISEAAGYHLCAAIPHLSPYIDNESEEYVTVEETDINYRGLGGGFMKIHLRRPALKKAKNIVEEYDAEPGILQEGGYEEAVSELADLARDHVVRKKTV